MSILFYGLVLFGTIAVAFTVYILVMIIWRSSRYQLSHPGTANPAEQKNRLSLDLNPYSASTFKYKKGIESTETLSERECIVCLSDFEDDEHVRQLSQCRHSFHAPCIDMWLFSHSDCPLCRTPVHRLASDDSVSTSCRTSIHRLSSDDGRLTRELTIENSMYGLLDIRISS